MGYLGFGLKESNYKRKPKEPFEKAKKVYGQMMEDSASPKGESLKDYYAELEALREKRRSKGKITSWIINFIAIAGMCFLIYMVLQYAGSN